MINTNEPLCLTPRPIVAGDHGPLKFIAGSASGQSVRQHTSKNTRAECQER